MNTNITAVIATERHQRYAAEAAQHRSSRRNRPARAQRPARQHSHRVSAFFKDLAAASL